MIKVTELKKKYILAFLVCLRLTKVGKLIFCFGNKLMGLNLLFAPLDVKIRI